MTTAEDRARDDLARAEFRRQRSQRNEELQTSPRRAHDLIRASIRLGLARDGQLRNEHVLVQDLATSRNAIREALQLLASEGIVTRQPRFGTRAAARIVEVPLAASVPPAEQRLTATSETPVDAAEVTILQLESRYVPTTPVMRHRLRTDDTSALMNEQLVTFDGVPVMVRVAYCPSSRVTPQMREHVNETQYEARPMGQALEALFGVPFGTVENAIEAVPCESRSAALLDVAVGTPVLMRELLISALDGTPYTLSYCHYRSDRVALTATVPII